MIRNLAKRGLALNILNYTTFFDKDKIGLETETEQAANISIVHTEDGWARLKRIFEIDEFGNLSKELVTILNVGATSSFVGALYGGVIHSRVAYTDFMKNNQATAFRDHLHAKKSLQDKVTLSFGKGAFMWSWRLTLFCTSFIGLSTFISEYRGKNGVVEYIGAGMFSGAIYKVGIGPKGMLVGGALGSVLGLIAGCTTVGLLKLTGISMDEVRYWQYHWKNDRIEYVNKHATAYMAKQDLAAIRMHNERIGDGGKNLEDLESHVNKNNSN